MNLYLLNKKWKPNWIISLPKKKKKRSFFCMLYYSAYDFFDTLLSSDISRVLNIPLVFVSLCSKLINRTCTVQHLNCSLSNEYFHIQHEISMSDLDKLTLYQLVVLYNEAVRNKSKPPCYFSHSIWLFIYGFYFISFI